MYKRDWAMRSIKQNGYLPIYSLWQALTPLDLKHAKAFVRDMSPSKGIEWYKGYSILVFGLFSAMTDKEIEEIIQEYVDMNIGNDW